ncbi:asparagine synthase-related protein [Clostridium saudiense]|uniref:asparagine synthase-related protein n=1 Tax=Clostridium saudiense TaxID=1414720 RepID=UPI000820DAB0|nr:asparagine synthase-related protein [Clostridium saudiense]MDU7453385.1 asparagine synthase-related protein [Clostridium saudiense]SCJ84132.1 Asparagine synthetase [glutamine-hydrolyzing] 1 [uncultured Clostridium sp.]
MRGSTLLVSRNKINIGNVKFQDIIEENTFMLYRNYNKKFENEKIFQKYKDLIIVIDGVILNSKELVNKYAGINLAETIYKMFQSNGIGFVDELRGNFYGFIYEEKSNTWYAFTNHLGNKPLYYYYNKEREIFCVSSDLFDIVSIMKKLNIQVELDELGAYYMLTFGYMLMDTTMISEVKKVEPGTILTYVDKKLSKEEYYFIDNEDYINDSEDKIISNMYELFNISIDQSFRKDVENGYKHISYLSGGLDSRMIGIVAKEMGYDNITTLTFAENNSRDEKIARSIAADYKFENIFKSLNNGNFLNKIEEAVDANFGQIIYSGAVHLLDATNSINLEPYGFLYNGNLADVMHGDYIEGLEHTKPSLSNWAYSSRLLNKVEFVQDRIIKKYGNEEKFAIYNRGVNAIYNGSISMLDTMETCEPYTHQDIVKYFTKMPPKYKYKEALFLKMIQKYYPKATDYKWQKWNVKPTSFNTKFMMTFFGKVYRVLDGKIQSLTTQSNNMNPFDKWYENNEQLREFVTLYLKENINYLDKYPGLKKDCIMILDNGKLIEKTQVMTLIQFIKRINEV